MTEAPVGKGSPPAPPEQLDTHPTPIRWIVDWPWPVWNRWQRTSVVGHLVSKALVGFAASLSALVLVLGLGPQAYQTVFWREAEYAKLQQLHPGNSLTYLVAQLGEPSFVKPVHNSRIPLTQHVFERRDHLVMALTNATGEVVLLSVLSCSPDFAPTFTSPVGTTVRLQSVPLSAAITGDAEGWASDEYRRVSYMPWLTASSMNQMVEEGAAVSNASRGRAYYVGVNGLCADLDSLGLGEDPYSGSLKEAPDSMQRARSRIAANFYAETVDLEVALRDNAQLDVRVYDTVETGLVVSPYHLDLPLSLTKTAGTRHF
ncbi:MAG TPA: ETEC_3214 domain-containing protein [Propionibacteriaceae bacterium]|nr:ETEC_3214 domain-containing protein [Propionibacteriaceae bacterium]